MSIRIYLASRPIPNIAVKVQTLRVSQFCVGYCCSLGGPIRCEEPSQSIRVIPRPKIIEPGFSIAFLASKFVMVGIAVGQLKFAAPRVVIRFVFNSAGCAHYHAGGI